MDRYGNGGGSSRYGDSRGSDRGCERGRGYGRDERRDRYDTRDSQDSYNSSKRDDRGSSSYGPARSDRYSSNSSRNNDGRDHYSGGSSSNNSYHDSNYSSSSHNAEPAESNEPWDPIAEAEKDPAWARIYVSNLPADITVEELQEIFGGIGIIAREKQKRGYKDQWPYKIKIYTDDEGKSKGDAVITYEDANAAKTAPSFFNGQDIRGNTIKVEIAGKPEPPVGGWQISGGRGRGRGRGGGGGGGRDRNSRHRPY